MKTLTAILVALVLALAGLGYGQYHKNSVLSTENQRLTEASKRAVERELEYRRMLGTRQKEIASQALKLKKAEQALSEALVANPAWADTPVPTNIQDALNAQ